MLEEEEVDLDIFVEDVIEEKKYLISVPPKVKCKELNKKLELLFETKYFEFRYRDKLYNEDQILKFEQGDTILFYKKEPPKEETQDIDELKKQFSINKYSGLLRLCLVKFIADKISDLKIVKNNDIANVLLELKVFIELKIDENNQIIFIKSKPNKKLDKLDIISYSEIICSKIGEKEINYLIEILDDIITKEIYNFANRLSIYESYIKFFEEELLEELKNSYFIYKILGIELLPIKNNKEYFEHSQNCKNKITKYLYHEIPQDSSNNFNNNNILYYSKKPYYGMGIYFSDKLDYIAYQVIKNNMINKNDKIVPICNNFCLNVSQIYYNNSLKKDIDGFKYLTHELDHYPTYDEIAKNYENKMVKKDGINIAQVKSDSRQLITSDNLKINLDKGQFIANEYVITEKEQILPLFNLHIVNKIKISRYIMERKK